MSKCQVKWELTFYIFTYTLIFHIKSVVDIVIGFLKSNQVIRNEHFWIISVFLKGYTGSMLKNLSWSCSGDHMRYQRSDLDRLPIRQVPYLLCYISRPVALFFHLPSPETKRKHSSLYSQICKFTIRCLIHTARQILFFRLVKAKDGLGTCCAYRRSRISSQNCLYYLIQE